MKSFRKSYLPALLCGAGVLVLGAPSSALSATFTLNLSGPATAVVGQPFVVQASGVDPTDQGALYLEVDMIPANVTETCPSGYLDASQLASSTGGDYVAFSDREQLDSGGNFSMPVGYTPQAPRQMLFCGYTDDGATDTLATASLLVTASNSPVSANAKPANSKRPRVTRSANNLVCSRGSWSNNPSGFSYRWLVDGKPKKGAHRAALAVTRKLHGHKVQCSVRASNSAGATTAISNPTTVR